MKIDNYKKALAIKKVFENDAFLEIDREYDEKRRKSNNYIQYNALIMKAFENDEIEGIKLKDIADLFYDGSVWDPYMFCPKKHNYQNENFDIEFGEIVKYVKEEMKKNISLNIVFNMPSTKSLVERLDEIT